MSSTYTKLRYHMIFDNRAQQHWLTPERSDELYRYMRGTISRHQGRLLDIGGTEDHVHVLTGIHPAVSASAMARLVKANSSRWLNEIGPNRGWFRWESGYGAFTVSESQVPRVRRFIATQRSSHRERSFVDEFGQLVGRHGFEFRDDPARRQRTYSWQRVQIVFSTKYRAALIRPAMENDLYATMAGVVDHMRGSLLAANGSVDHVHLLVAIPPTVAVADLVGSIKQKSAGWMVTKGGVGLPFVWQRGYAAFSISLSQMPATMRYIKGQKEHHRTISFADELRDVLREHGLVLQPLG